MSASVLDERGGPPVALALAWLALLACACWAWLAFQGAQAPDVALHGIGQAAAGPPPAPPAPLRAGQLVLVFAMWTGLYVALMLPAAAGAVIGVGRIAKRRGALGWPRVAPWLFALGCLLAWTGFAALVTLMHWTLHDAGMLDATLAVRHPAATGLVLVAAGAWQWTSSKHACLQYCRAPFPSLLSGWGKGPLAALWQGAEHARTCLGCYWLVALLPLAGGPGNPGMVAAVGLLLLAELRLKDGALVSCLAGLAMVAWGTRLLFP